MSSPRYCVITPVRDEAAHLPRLAAAMLAQQERPTHWVLVDDGSTDGTRQIADRLAAEHPWITVIGGAGDAPRARGGRVVAAFEHGYATIAEPPPIVVKLDADLHLPPHYFAWVMRAFRDNPQVGIAGGVLMEHNGRVWRPAGFDPRHVRGAFKAYRCTCLEQIGGLRHSMGWDGIDEYGARGHGWEVAVLTELVVLHYAPRGSKQHWFRARVEEGRACHYMGYRADFLLARTPLRALSDRPPLLGALAILIGFAQSALRRTPQIDDPAARGALRAEQGARLRAMLRGRTALPPTPLAGGGPAMAAPEPGAPPAAEQR